MINEKFHAMTLGVKNDILLCRCLGIYDKKECLIAGYEKSVEYDKRQEEDEEFSFLNNNVKLERNF